jgi:hypothetical protein
MRCDYLENSNPLKRLKNICRVANNLDFYEVFGTLELDLEP